MKTPPKPLLAIFCAVELEECQNEDVQSILFWDEVTETWGWMPMCFTCALESYYIFNPEERP